jgi:hypothetical protein
VSINDWELTKLKKIVIMLKNILKLEGAQKLTAKEKKSIIGGGSCDRIHCAVDFECRSGVCFPKI